MGRHNLTELDLDLCQPLARVLRGTDPNETSGDLIGLQIRQAAAKAGGTPSVYGMQFQPRFEAGVGGNSLIGIQVNPMLRGTSGGALTGDVRGLQVDLEVPSGCARTVAGVIAGLWIREAVFLTPTKGAHLIYVKTHEGYGFADVLAVESDGTAGIAVTTGKSLGTEGAQATIPIKVGTKTYYLLAVETLS